jgi:hypothetical protein
MNKKFSNWIMMLLILGVFSCILSCGGGGGGGGGGEADFASISVDGGQPVRYTLTADTNAPDGYSPDVWGMLTSPQNAHIYCQEWVSSAYVMRFQIDVYYFDGVHAGNYLINDSGNWFQFSPQGGAGYSAMGGGTSGTITITELGGAGGKIKGTFDVIAEVNSMPTSTARVTGSFSVTRSF